MIELGLQILSAGVEAAKAFHPVLLTGMIAFGIVFGLAVRLPWWLWCVLVLTPVAAALAVPYSLAVDFATFPPQDQAELIRISGGFAAVWVVTFFVAAVFAIVRK